MAVFKSDPNLQGLWLLNEAGGTRYDNTDNNNDLADNNTVGSTALDQKEGTRSANFERDNSEYLSILDASQTGLDITGNISFGCWFKPESDGIGQRLIAKYNPNGDQRSYMLMISEDDEVVCWLSDDGATETKCFTATSIISSGSWYHLVVVYNGTDIRIYVNGSLSSNGANNPKSYIDGIFNGSASFRIGSRDNDGVNYYADGLVDEAFVFNRALSAAEVQSIYSSGIQDPYSAGFYHWIGGLLRLIGIPLPPPPIPTVSFITPRKASLIVTDFNGVSRRLEGALRRRWSSHYGPEGSGFGYLIFSLSRKIGYDYQDIGFGYRTQLRKGLATVLFDGQICRITENQSNLDQIDIMALGWNVLATDDTFNWIFCDTRYMMWRGSETPSGSFRPDKFDYDLQERIQFKPRRGVDYEANDYGRVRYTFPFGEVAERIKFDYDVALPGAWPGKLEVRDSNGVVLWSRTTTGNGTGQNLTTTDSPTYFEVRFYVASAGENTAEDGTVYGRLTNLKVYGVDDATVDGGVIAKKMLSAVLSQSYHGLSISTARIESPGLALEPAAFDTDMSPEQVLSWLCKFGDSDGNPLAWGVTMNDCRRLFLETMDLTTIQYVVLRESALQAQVSGDMQESYQKVYAVWTDTVGEVHRSDDRVDQEAIDALGGTVRRRALSVDGVTDETQALKAIDLYLAENALPKTSSSFTIQGNVYTPALNPVPFDEIRAGGMVQVRDFRAREATLTLNDFRDQWTTFQLVGVEVDEDTHSVRLIPAGDVSGFERYMALLAQLRGGA